VRPVPTRRGFLTGAAAAAVGAAVTTAGIRSADAGADAGASAPPTSPAGSDRFAFEGPHQAGVVTPQQRAAALVALDVTAANRAELTELLKTITEQVRFLTAGGTPADPGITAPPVDNGVVGPEIQPDGLTVTLSVGASLFDGRFGLAARKPAKLTTMSAAPFPNDALQSTSCDGDLLLQICANETDTVLHALRQITKATRGGAQIRWRQDGFQSVPRPSGAPRNLLGFKDGIANPKVDAPAQMDALVWAHGGANGEPGWATGGTYHVVRLIRMLVEFWDRVDVREQEQMIGRRKDTGAPMTGGGELTPPDYDNDPTGEAVLFSAHIRKANPRTPQTADSQMLRRAYNYDNGVDLNGQLQQGLVFVAFNQDLERQFKAVQTRLIDEPLVDYVSPYGGGYFFALPGVSGPTGWLGQALLA
jgi:deferrochelatase/peroxidase EfeB